MTARRSDIAGLPDWPRGLSLDQAAAYVGVAPETFLKFVKVPHRKLGSRRVWDRATLDAWFDSSPGTMDDAPSPTVEEAIASWGKSR